MLPNGFHWEPLDYCDVIAATSVAQTIVHSDSSSIDKSCGECFSRTEFSWQLILYAIPGFADARGEDYRRYQETTSAFIPWFPKKIPIDVR